MEVLAVRDVLLYLGLGLVESIVKVVPVRRNPVVQKVTVLEFRPPDPWLIIWLSKKKFNGNKSTVPDQVLPRAQVLLEHGDYTVPSGFISLMVEPGPSY